MVQNHWPAYKSQVAFEDFSLQHRSDGWPASRQTTRRAVGRSAWRRRDHWCVTEAILSINSRPCTSMVNRQTVNDGKKWQRGGCGRRATTVNRTLSRGSIRSKIAYFGGWKKSFTLWPAYKSLPQLLGQDFVVNFATYTRVYTVYFLQYFYI